MAFAIAGPDVPSGANRTAAVIRDFGHEVTAVSVFLKRHGAFRIFERCVSAAGRYTLLEQIVFGDILGEGYGTSVLKGKEVFADAVGHLAEGSHHCGTKCVVPLVTAGLVALGEFLACA